MADEAVGRRPLRAAGVDQELLLRRPRAERRRRTARSCGRRNVAGTSMTRVTASPARRGGGAPGRWRRGSAALRAAMPWRGAAPPRPSRPRAAGRTRPRRRHRRSRWGRGVVDGAARTSGGADGDGRTRQRAELAAGSRPPCARPPRPPAVEPRRRHVGRPLRPQRHDQQRHAGAERLRAQTRAGRATAGASRPRSAGPRRSSRTRPAASGSGCSTRIPSCCMPRNRLCRSA